VTRPDLWQDIIGLDLPAERRAALMTAFAPIAAEIRKLRGLDLTDVHPAVVFTPPLPTDQS
jgi:hypothetical protein